MPTLPLSVTLLDGYVALFAQLRPRDQTIFLNRQTKSVKEKDTTSKDIPEMLP